MFLPIILSLIKIPRITCFFKGLSISFYTNAIADFYFTERIVINHYFFFLNILLLFLSGLFFKISNCQDFVVLM